LDVVYACGGAYVLVVGDGKTFASDASASDALPGDACPLPSHRRAQRLHPPGWR
jgi:hypothetical protein